MDNSLAIGRMVDYIPRVEDETREGMTMVQIGNALYVRSVTREYSDYSGLGQPCASVVYWRLVLTPDQREHWEWKWGKLGQRLTMAIGSNGMSLTETGVYVGIDGGGQHQADYQERLVIPCPKQRGRALPLRYRQGHWEKETARGWIGAE